MTESSQRQETVNQKLSEKLELLECLTSLPKFMKPQCLKGGFLIKSVMINQQTIPEAPVSSLVYSEELALLLICLTGPVHLFGLECSTLLL